MVDDWPTATPKLNAGVSLGLVSGAADGMDGVPPNEKEGREVEADHEKAGVLAVVEELAPNAGKDKEGVDLEGCVLSCPSAASSS